MCQTIRQTNHSCGHQVLTSMGKSKFCLFFPHEAEEFHSVITVYVNGPQGYPCYECKVKMDAFGNGLKGAEKYQYVKNRYAKSREAQSKATAGQAIAAAKKSQQCKLSAEKVAQLNENARTQVAFYFRKNRVANMTQRAILLRTIIQMPDVIDRKSLVKYFASYVVWDWTDKAAPAWKGLPSANKAVLTTICRRAGLTKTFEEGLKEPRPLEAKAAEVN
ncbi:uncharacterized protein GGS22DRAFT_197701 [Annulohypoxylon maeteangense]|uniref:uncharacterized protein n=1 Tax=Annulohypoxylon maeteangense TaxID=1927788 RepID=UPI002007D25C|nr:uncharacterized protein GGS22DRAFT_197701 [Annulohypoxylon maeteangense]KAI0887716.1 hypothetical protein GGS22DRAFT_197701 [Annulohypoxylon maeteangense]